MITIYTTPTCPWCRATKDYLNSKKIKYKEVDVSNNKKAAMEMVKKSGQYGVPVIESNGTIIIGFDQEKLDGIIKSQNHKK